MAKRDIYDRRPTSTSRGRTHDRIMALQHAPGVLPGAETVLADAPPGSIAEAVVEFHRTWVEPKPVTTRRAYERSLTLFVRDLAASGPVPSEVTGALSLSRLAAHLDWRLAAGLDDVGELQRSALHLARFAEWVAARDELAGFADARPAMRAAAAARVAAAPPAFHVATTADELRDTGADAARLGVDEDDRISRT